MRVGEDGKNRYFKIGVFPLAIMDCFSYSSVEPLAVAIRHQSIMLLIDFQIFLQQWKLRQQIGNDSLSVCARGSRQILTELFLDFFRIKARVSPICRIKCVWIACV